MWAINLFYKARKLLRKVHFVDKKLAEINCLSRQENSRTELLKITSISEEEIIDDQLLSMDRNIMKKSFENQLVFWDKKH